MGLNLKLCLLAFGIFIASSVLHAQEVVEPKVEVFAGAELHYRISSMARFMKCL